MYEKPRVRQPALGRDFNSRPSEQETKMLFILLQRSVQHLHIANITTIWRAI
jgi:hypothetical protein